MPPPCRNALARLGLRRSLDGFWMKRFSVQWLVVAFLLAAVDVLAHEVSGPASDALAHAAKQAAPGAPVEILAGSVHRLVIRDTVAGVLVTEYSLRLDDGHVLALRDVADPALATGDRVEATGRRNGSAMFVSS